MSRVRASHRAAASRLDGSPPEGPDWMHEVKHDAFRSLLSVEAGKVLAFTRNGHDWSERYPGVVTAAGKLLGRTAI